ncbi:unnamed protein product [Caenorhabditis angaria]|uniref:Uncharacterized protein n=1 Tax=Caenorhabditis angaria TaxID=860376 RepID=A0A9P1J3Z5_9PELO|nr:unnamed protein product [Caenorhabditis angaria]
MAKLDFTHGKVSDCLEENIEKQGDKSNNYQLIGFDYNNSVETERINVLPGPDYVPVRKINKLPMERPTTLAIRPNGSNTLVDQTG